MKKIEFSKISFDLTKIKRFFLGKQDGKGLIPLAATYVIMIGIAYIYVYPILQMFVQSIMTVDDMVSMNVTWIPRNITWDNYSMVLLYFKLETSIFDSMLIAGSSTIAAVGSSMLIGYGLARYNFRFKKVIFVLMIGLFALPPQILSIPRYVIFNDLGLIGNLLSFLLPALTGQGLNQAIFIIIFYQFFKQIPKVLVEAAQIEGAGHFKVFSTIYVPLSAPAVITTTLYSFIWYWNAQALTREYLGRTYSTIVMRLTDLLSRGLLSEFETMFPPDNVLGFDPEVISITYAGNIAALIPLLVIYIIMQKWFIESVDNTGITGE